MATLGSMVGGFLVVLLLAIVWEKLLFSRVYDDPVKGKLSSVLAGWVSASIFGGFGLANGGPFDWSAFSDYFLPALLIAFLGYRRGLKIREETEAV